MSISSWAYHQHCTQIPQWNKIDSILIVTSHLILFHMQRIKSCRTSYDSNMLNATESALRQKSMKWKHSKRLNSNWNHVEKKTITTTLQQQCENSEWKIRANNDNWNKFQVCLTIKWISMWGQKQKNQQKYFIYEYGIYCNIICNNNNRTKYDDVCEKK